MKTIQNLTPALLIFSSLFPLTGLLLYGWGMKEIILLYWAETLVIGIFSIIKSLLARANPEVVAWLTGSGYGIMLWPYKVLIAFLVSVAVGAYALVTGMAVGFMTLVIDYGIHDLPDGITPPEFLFSQFTAHHLWLFLGIICLEHALSFVLNFILKKEYLRNQDRQQMEILGRRVGAILNPVVPCMILFAILVSLEGRLSHETVSTIQKVPAALLIFSKTFLDFRSHRREHAFDGVQKAEDTRVGSQS
ncbi:MAG: hypothetical protein JXA07_04485 [Spirochaetes bacterium]|nr:hypothetical protein [Spirochaetota bacterium]